MMNLRYIFRFCPIIPMVLVNGAEGIGTGWATKVLCYNPKQVIRNVQRMIDGQPLQKMVLLCRFLPLIGLYDICILIVLKQYLQRRRLSQLCRTNEEVRRC